MKNLCVAMAATCAGKRKADDDEGSSGPALVGRHIQNEKAVDDENEISSPATAAVTASKEKAAADDENEISGAAPGRKEEKEADGPDLSASSPARKETMTAEDGAPGAASAHKRKAGFPAFELHCPQCGFHLGTFQVTVTPAKSTSPTETGIAQADAPQAGGTGDASVKDGLTPL